MSNRPKWSYAQTRLQARHGARLREEDWRVAEAMRSFEQFLECVNGSSLIRFTRGANAQMSGYAIERTLRSAWYTYVAEISKWVPVDWRPAVLWAAYVPDLPLIAILFKGDAPEWLAQDPALANLIRHDTPRWRQTAVYSPSMLLAGFTGAGSDLPQYWLSCWKLLWPAQSNSGIQLFQALVETVKAHVEQLRQAGFQEKSMRYRMELAHSVTQLFRQCVAQPVSVFCHLILLALDLERLRGNLLRRRLFPADGGGAI